MENALHFTLKRECYSQSHESDLLLQQRGLRGCSCKNPVKGGAWSWYFQKPSLLWGDVLKIWYSIRIHSKISLLDLTKLFALKFGLYSIWPYFNQSYDHCRFVTHYIMTCMFFVLVLYIVCMKHPAHSRFHLYIKE